jgi:hypothetical protein
MPLSRQKSVASATGSAKIARLRRSRGGDMPRTVKNHLEFANFICKFGDQVLMDHADEIVLPAVTSGRTRRFGRAEDGEQARGRLGTPRTAVRWTKAVRTAARSQRDIVPCLRGASSGRGPELGEGASATGTSQALDRRARVGPEGQCLLAA